MNDRILALRDDAANIFQAGIKAADPFQAVCRCLAADEDHLEIGLDPANPERKRQGRWNKIHVIAFGKAACAMANATREIIPVHLLAEPGIVVTNYENAVPAADMRVMAAGHPLPDPAGLEAAAAVAERVAQAQENELVLVLVSGGGSALLPYPVEGVNLADKIATTDLLLASGASINQINCVRKHLSRLKGGGLAKLAAPADLHALILSDVLGDDLSAIASGPTVADDTRFNDAVAVLRSKNIWDKIPSSVREHLEKGCRGEVEETPKSGDPIFKTSGHTLIGSNRISVDAAMRMAQQLNYDAMLYNDHLSGEAREVAEQLVLHAKDLQQRGLRQATALLAGGETTVTLKGSGRGGRNQEMALAFALAAEKHRLPGRWVFLSGGTDGRDGPTDAAGGLVDPGTVGRIAEPAALLENNDSYRALTQSQDLLDTGATGTNVADLQVLLIQPLSSS
ncbi:glycerate kinase type-2 family protein [Methylomarinum vadi]|uniref:glycerate kinase type-2 family protein n=1 Tax=Methylomarinum vadi TaxID=438855 RepID=UPI0004DF0CB2|nr:glycerate kinase [Methylomarinum vadi]